MKKLLLVAALAIMPLSACHTVGTVFNAATTAPCTHTLADEKVRWAGEAVYNVTASAYRSANERGLLTAELRATIKPKLQQLGAYLKGLRAAHQICDTTTLLSYKAGMERLSAEVLPLIPN